MTEMIVSGGTVRSNSSRARDYKPDRNTRDKERRRDGRYSRASERHQRQCVPVPQITGPPASALTVQAGSPATVTRPKPVVVILAV